jgi:hypothetical protein
MALRLGINLGFVTNSSSVIHHFPVEILQDPTVKAFIESYEISKGFVGSDLWHRGQCGTFAVTQEQKKDAQRQLNSLSDDYSNIPGISTEADSVVVIYGDEYRSIASSLSYLMQQAAQKMGLKHRCGSDQYN